MTIIPFTDCLGVIANYLPFKDAIKISLLNKVYNRSWLHIKYGYIVKFQDLDPKAR